MLFAKLYAIAKEQGIKSAYFLQPAPPYGKVLTEQEKQAVGDLSYGPMYRRMVAGMMTLRDRGLPIFDLGDLLKDEKGTFYADAITSAKSTLTSTGRTNVQKAIILISDGDASASSSNMPTAEKNNQCNEAITAAQSATTPARP